MNSVKTIYGIIKGIVSFETYADGDIRSCILKEYNLITTSVGSFVPQYNIESDGERQKKYRSSIAFFPNGLIKSVALDAQIPIKTPMGTYPAELLTFYENGSINRIFPQNGKIDGFWSEEAEGEKAEIYSFDFSFGKFKAKIIGLHFYPSGALKSLTLWPGERITLQTKYRKITVQNGFSLYEDGSLKSLEPAGPTLMNTKIGEIMAYDIDALGIHGDENSVNFDIDGELISLKSTHTGIEVLNQKGQVIRIEPLEVESIIDETETTIVPIKVVFEGEKIIVSNRQIWSFEYSSHEFTTYKRMVSNELTCSSCSKCSGCH